MMKNNLVSIAVGSAVFVATTTAWAVPFNSFDPKSMAMGGAGVAVGNPSTAPFFNPSLLSVADQNDDFSMEIPIIGARVYDPDDFVDAVDEFDETVVDDLDASIDQYNLSQTTANANQVISDINIVNDEVLTLSDKPFQFEGGAGIVLSIPGEKFGIAISASGSASISGILNYADADTVSNMTSDLTALNALSACFDGSLTTQAEVEACVEVSLPDGFNYVDVDPDSPTFGDVVFTASSSSGDPSDIQSTVRVLGVIMAEAGLTISREIAIFGTEVAVGLTPKMVSVTVLDYEASADSADTDDIDGDNFTTDYSDFNLDIGFAMDHKNGWRSGLVIKNIISQDYDAMNTDPLTGIESATGTVISLKPQIRAGISHSNSWSTIALDVDLTENEGLGLAEEDSRYIALGIELNALDWAQLRLGYRADTLNSDRNVVSAGFGLSPLGIHVDLGVAGNEDEVGASFQFGFRF